MIDSSVSEAKVKLFAVTNFLLEQDLDRVEREHMVDLRRDHHSVVQVDKDYYPQIEAAIRAEAAEMAPHYEVFYSLECTIRELVRSSLDQPGVDWWKECVPGQVCKAVELRQKKEQDDGITPRSDDRIDYTTFGELGEIIKTNWDVFGATFSSQKAVGKVMANLNSLRAAIAHCSPLAEDEVVRLRLAVRDWFRLSDAP